MHRYIITILLFLLIAPATVRPQLTESFVFHNMPLQQSSQVYCVTQDTDGMIWLGTDAGPYCFDGYRYISHSSSEVCKSIYSILAVDDYVFMGSMQGFSLYNRKTDTFLKYKGTCPLDVRALIRQGDNILIGSSKGLYSFNLKTAAIVKLSSTPKNILSLAINGHDLLIGSLYGLYKYASGQCTAIPLVSGLQLPSVSCIEQTGLKNQFWIGTYNHLLRYNAETGQSKIEKELGNIVVKSIHLVNGTLVIAADDGLYIYKDKRIKHMVHDSKDPFSLGNNIVWSILHDQWNNIILGTDDGLSIISQTNLYAYHSVASLSGSSVGNSLSHIFQDSFGEQWLGGTSGIIRLNPTVAWFKQNDKQNPISHNRIRTIFEDSDRNLLISTDIGINIYERTKGRMRNLMLYDEKKKHECPWIYDILEYPAGTLWMASFDGGIYIVDKSKMLAANYQYTAKQHLTKGLKSLHINRLVQGSNDKIWALTDKGLNVIDALTFKIADVADGQTFEQIISDQHGNIWTVNNKGLSKFTSAAEPPEFIGFNHNLQIEHISSLLEVNGDIWIITPSTCTIYSDKGWKTLLQTPYIKARCAYYSATEKEVVIGGIDGLVIINPLLQKQSRQNQKILLSDLFVNGLNYEIKGESLTYTKALKLNHDKNNLEIMLTDLPLRNSMNGLYAYRLKGLENTWHFLQNVGSKITYNSLPYGNYKLEVNSVDGFGQIGGKLYSLSIEILPPWYLTVWAKLIYIILFIALMLWTLNFYLIRHRLKMEREARERILKESDARMKFYNNLSRRLHKGLGNIMSHLVALTEKKSEKLHSPDIDCISYESTKLNSCIRQAFDMGDLSFQYDNESTVKTINVVAYCASLIKGIESDFLSKEITFEYSSNDSYINYETNIIEWDAVIYNILRYITEYSDKGAHIELSISRLTEHSAFKVSVASDKFLISENQLSNIFKRYSDIVEKDMTDLYLAHEMYFVKDYIEQHHGFTHVVKGINDKVVLELELPICNDITEVKNKEDESLKRTIVIDQNDEKLFKEITTAIENNLSDSDFNVTKLHEVVGIGSKLLYRKTKQMVGLSPVEYIRLIRMKRAAILLSQSKFSVSEVMYSVGFTNSGYFSKCFQKAFGTTPTKYAQQSEPNLTDK